MTAPRTVRLVTLGCKVNQYETQHLKEMLQAAGFREADDGRPADLCVVNTCTVTAEADAKGRQAVRRLALENPGAEIVVTGCFAARDPETVRRLPGVTRVLPDKDRLAEGLADLGVRPRPEGISRFDGHQRAFVKVQDGCLLNCSYCIIPTVRPTLRSRPVRDILDEVHRLVDGGCPEVVLTGIHLGHYGIDLSRGRPRAEWQRLWHLLDALADLPGDFRIRLSSLEAAEVRDGLVRTLRGHPRICPHLHLCLQSGSDAVLAAMKRRYTRTGFLERVRRLREALDEPAFTTDVIVGFPGETDADFEATCSVLEEVGFCKVHVFSYSPRQGTAAARLDGRAGRPGPVPPPVVAARRRRLRDLERDLAHGYARRLFGRPLDVLVEGPAPDRPGWVVGTSCRHLPVAFPGHLPALVRRRVPIRPTAFTAGMLLGHPEPPAEPASARRRPLLVAPELDRVLPIPASP